MGCLGCVIASEAFEFVGIWIALLFYLWTTVGMFALGFIAEPIGVGLLVGFGMLALYELCYVRFVGFLT